MLSGFVQAYDHRLILVQSGSVTLETGNGRCILEAHSAAILPPATAYQLESPKKVCYFLVNFDFVTENEDGTPIPPSFRSQFLPERIFSTVTSPQFPMTFRCDEEGPQILEAMLRAYTRRGNFFREYLSAELKRFVIQSLIYTDYDRTPTSVKEILAYLNQHEQEKISLSALAAHFSYHPNYLTRLFRKHTGKTIRTYLTERQLVKAKALLTSTDDSISKICEQCGFHSDAYFIKCFRIYTGSSPLQYRKNNFRNL